MRTRRVVLAVAVLLACAGPSVWPAGDVQVAQLPLPPKPMPLPRVPLVILRPPIGIGPRLPLPNLPDLMVEISGPSQAVAGTNVNLTMTVRNAGTAVALGTMAAPVGHFYFIDEVLSTDCDFPVRLAVWPGYAGKTRDDFVEDMLMEGGRDVIQENIPPGGLRSYSHPVYIPKNTPPGVYCIGAVVDPARAVLELREWNNTGCFKLTIAPPGTPPVSTGPGVWVMPYAVGGTPINRIKPTGLTDYTDGSGLAMNDAPFGSYLGLRHGYDASLPSPAIQYYRWLYLREGEAEWHEFNQPVGVHYQKEQAGHVTFPVYSLGPKSVGSKLLYEFRPHAAPPEPGATTSWPVTDWFGDIYSGFFNSPAVLDGRYRIKLEVYSPTGVQVMPGPGTFRFIVPTGVGPGSEILTRNAMAPEVDAGGYFFNMVVDNHACSAVIDNPQIGATNVADPCGFLRYNNRNTDQITIAYHATHPRNFAVFGFNIVRAATTVDSASGEAAAATAGVYSGDGSGDFSHNFVLTQLMSPTCPGWAAYAEVLHVYAKATTGWGSRISGYDAGAVRAYAIAPNSGMPPVPPTPMGADAGPPPAFKGVAPADFKGPAPPEFDMLGIPMSVPVAPEHLLLMRSVRTPG